jgi:hypothetical protein
MASTDGGAAGWPSDLVRTPCTVRRPGPRGRRIGERSPSSWTPTWTAGRDEPRVGAEGADMAYALGGGHGQALAMQSPTPPLAPHPRPGRPVVPRMPRLRTATDRSLQGRSSAHRDQLIRPATTRPATRRLSLAMAVVTIARRRLALSSSATTSTTERALPVPQGLQPTKPAPRRTGGRAHSRRRSSVGCRRRGSNPHALVGPTLLRRGCLPIPALRRW